jgi:hypothetical protein
MKTAVLEMPNTDTAVESQQFRITQAAFGKDMFSLQYQLYEGFDWSKPRKYDFGAFLVQTGTPLDNLKASIKRVFGTEEDWSNTSINIGSIKLTYVEPKEEVEEMPVKKKGKPKAPKPGDGRKPGELLKVAIASSYQSPYTFSDKDLALGTFEQMIEPDEAGEAGYLDKLELQALGDLLNELGRELARQLNKRVVFKPQQMKLF